MPNDKVQQTLKPVHFVMMWLALIGCVLGGVIIMAGQFGKFDLRIMNNGDKIEELMDFKEQGKRFTQEDAIRLENQLNLLTAEVRKYPPQWFRAAFEEVKLDVKHNRTVLDKLAMSVRILQELEQQQKSNPLTEGD